MPRKLKMPKLPKMRKPRWIAALVAGTLAALCTIATAALLLSHAVGASSAAYPNGLEVISPAPKCPGPVYEPPGASAITPRNNCTPSFTVQDVLDYEHAHPFGNRRMQSVGQPKVTKVLFITSAQASQRLHGESIGLPDDALVCFVEMYGSYRFYPPFGAGSVSEHTGTMHEIFDARTGILLVSGS